MPQSAKIFAIFAICFGLSCQGKRTATPEKPIEKKEPEISQKTPVFNGVIDTLKEADIPKPFYNKNLRHAYSWADADGTHLLFFYISKPQIEKSPKYMEDEKRVDFKAEQYVKQADTFKAEWTAIDGVQNCAFDMWLDVFEKSISVTDLDSNGVAEVSFMYSLACRSDVSPSNIKLLMYEKGQKMALRGYAFLEIAGAKMNKANFEPDISKIKFESPLEIGDSRHWGRFENANDFKTKPKIFLEYSRKKWLEFITKDQFKQF